MNVECAEDDEARVTAALQSKLYKAFEVPGPRYDLSTMVPRVAGGLILAALAYPEASAVDLRYRTALRLSGRSALNPQGEGAWFPVAGAEGVLLPADLKALYGGAKRFDARIRKRIDAGMIALQPILAAERKQAPLRRWGDRWNRAAAVRKAVEEGGVHDPKNFNHRYWESSLAVMHLAAAWTAMLIDGRKAGGPQGDPNRIVIDDAYRAELVHRAMAMEPLVEQSDLRIPQQVLIRFRLGSV